MKGGEKREGFLHFRGKGRNASPNHFFIFFFLPWSISYTSPGTSLLPLEKLFPPGSFFFYLKNKSSNPFFSSIGFIFLGREWKEEKIKRKKKSYLLKQPWIKKRRMFLKNKPCWFFRFKNFNSYFF